MTIGELVRELKGYPMDKDIEVECPNGMTVSPRIKYRRAKLYDSSSAVTGYIITWRE